MKSIPFGCQTSIQFPVINRSEVFCMTCGINFSVMGRAEVLDEIKFAEKGKNFLNEFKENFPIIMKAAMAAIWEKNMPMNPMPKAMKTLEENVVVNLANWASPYGLRLVLFRILECKVCDEDRKQLLENEDPDVLKKEFEKISQTMIVDESYKPWVHGGNLLGKWQCSCGRINTTKFCPECGKSSETGKRM